MKIPNLKKCSLSDEVFNQIVKELQESVPKLSIPFDARPASLDVDHLDLILKGIRRRAAQVLGGKDPMAAGRNSAAFT